MRLVTNPLFGKENMKLDNFWLDINNFLFFSDGYKLVHWKMDLEKTNHKIIYLEARKGAMYHETVFFGLQVILDQLQGKKVTREWIDQMEQYAKLYFMQDGYFHKEGWEYILDKHDGKLPIRIKAVPEGTVVPVGHIMLSVENMDEDGCPWLTSWLPGFVEGITQQVWYPSTVATRSRSVKKIFKKFLDSTSDNGEQVIKFMLHDFGFRAVSCIQQARLGGMAHLINFVGTDTLPAIPAAQHWYNADITQLAGSVAASEHGIMTILGKRGEGKVLRHLLQQFPTGPLSIVIDSYDSYDFVDNKIGVENHDIISNRNGIAIMRPDSNTSRHPRPADQVVWILNSLAKRFGYSMNSKLYKVLDPHVRVIWGDGLTEQAIEEILIACMEAGYSVENLVFGMGGGLLQKLNRDTQRMAMKLCAIDIDGQWYEVVKNPLDPSKASKPGRMGLFMKDGKLETIQVAIDDPEADTGLLKTVFELGEIILLYDFDADVRANAKL